MEPGSVITNYRTRGSGYKLEQQEVPLKHEKKRLHSEGDRHWNRLPREVVESPSLETFKTCLDTFLCNLNWVFLLRQGDWTR